MGGSLRQAGISAAGCIYALDHNVDRLAEDHENARTLARAVMQLPGLRVEMPETNLVYLDVSGTGLDADAVAGRLRERGVLVSVMGRHRVRACTHLDVDRAGVERAAAAIREVVAAG